MPVQRTTVKSVLRRSKLADNYFVSRFAAAPYHACAHACKYCDGRAEKYWVEGDFEHDITVRANFVEVFAREVGKLRERGIVMFGSGVTDPYQPLEEREQLMRGAAGVLLEANLPATIMTKSALVRRDLDLWSQLHRNAGFTLYMTVITLDDGLRQVFEPHASPIAQRLDTLRAFKEAGCTVGVMAMPLLPWLCDQPEQLEALFGACASIGVDVVFPGGLTLRPGRQKETFLQTLESHAPHMLPSYLELFGQNRPSGSPRPQRSERQRAIRHDILDRLGLITCLPHACYRDRLSLADELYVLISHLSQLFPTGDHTHLRVAQKQYTQWLQEHRVYVARRRNLHYSVVDTQLRDVFASGQFRAVLRNDRLFEFLAHRVLQDMTYDYHTKEWRHHA